MQASYGETDDALKFNLALSVDILAQIHGATMVNQVLDQGDSTDETKRRRLLALTGWNCKKMAKESQE